MQKNFKQGDFYYLTFKSSQPQSKTVFFEVIQCETQAWDVLPESFFKLLVKLTKITLLFV